MSGALPGALTCQACSRVPSAACRKISSIEVKRFTIAARASSASGCGEKMSRSCIRKSTSGKPIATPAATARSESKLRPSDRLTHHIEDMRARVVLHEPDDIEIGMRQALLVGRKAAEHDDARAVEL